MLLDEYNNGNIQCDTHGHFKVCCMYNTRCIISCNSRSRFNTRITVSHHSDRLEEGGTDKTKKNCIKLVLC